MTRAMEQSMDAPARVLRLPRVQTRTGLARSTIYVRVADGSFPQADPARRARRRLDRVRSGCVDPRPGRGKPWPRTVDLRRNSSDSSQ